MAAITVACCVDSLPQERLVLVQLVELLVVLVLLLAELVELANCHDKRTQID